MSTARIVLTGASGRLGARLLDRFHRAGATVIAWSRRPAGAEDQTESTRVDLSMPTAPIEAALDAASPSVVVHAAAISGQAEVWNDPERALLVNVRSTERIAAWCRANSARLLFTSTDMVFSGEKSWWSESDEPQPVLAYGQTKAKAEGFVLALQGSLVVRLSLLFGRSPAGKESFFDLALADFGRGIERTFFADEFRTPLDYATAARIVAELALNPAVAGVVHVGGKERITRYELMHRSARALGLDDRLVRAGALADFAGPEPRPRDLSLDTSLLERLLPGARPPTIEESLRREVS